MELMVVFLCSVARALVAEETAGVAASLGIRYLVRTEPWNGRTSWAGLVELESLRNVDDTPMAGVEFDFEFPFLAQSRRVGFVNANGAVLFEPTPPCGSHFGWQSEARCDINTSWHALVALFVTDLDPSRSSRSRILAGTDDARFAVRYENASAFGASPGDPTATMGAVLHRDGLVEIVHEAVALVAADTSSGLVGVRLDDNHTVVRDRAASPQNSTRGSARVVVTSAQAKRKGLWGTSVPGAYAGALPRDETRIVACPVPEEWCVAWPSFEEVEEATTTKRTLEVSANFFGCGRELATFGFFCAIVTPLGEVHRSSAATLSRRRENATLRCEFEDEAVLVDAAARAHAVEIRYATPSDDLDGGAGDGGAATETPTERKLVARVDLECAGSVASENKKNSSCASSPYFSRADCAGWRCEREPRFADALGACCEWEEADCFGQCGGAAYPLALAISDDEETRFVETCYCDSSVDCRGTCGGEAVVDSCGVCDGQDAAKDVCGVCFGTARLASQCDDSTDDSTDDPPDAAYDDTMDDEPPVPLPSSSSSGRRTNSLLRSIEDHPWVVVIVALEIIVSIACFRSCTARRSSRFDFERNRLRHNQSSAEGTLGLEPADPELPTLLTQRDLDDLVLTSLSPEDVYYVAHGVSAGGRRNAFAISRDPSRRRFIRPTPLGATLSEVRARVAEAYELAVASLCATPTASARSRDSETKVDDGVDDDSGRICAICLDPLGDARRCVHLPNCNHEFHRDCVYFWLSGHNSCPCCKRRAVERVEAPPVRASSRTLRAPPRTTPSPPHAIEDDRRPRSEDSNEAALAVFELAPRDDTVDDDTTELHVAEYYDRSADRAPSVFEMRTFPSISRQASEPDDASTAPPDDPEDPDDSQ
ncbi:hypothetical protein CTAYLR_002716 [Chrysophaeum taylorii]|uniref:RING-type domain-containing protein n=1 Tax=Chrysophaeum taylorii TaxID=2483200 RepID=A0AAD7UCD4_9STRA|nr:hypothetical protein CTAYLR_002716 [Chrysophaeum taylorii]